MKTQLATYETRHDAQIVSKNEVLSLFDASVLSLVETIRIRDNDEEVLKAFEVLPDEIRWRAALKISDIPYAMFCQMARGDGFERDPDEWYVVISRIQ